MTTPSNARSRVLVFCRFYLAEDFRDNVAPLAAEFDFSFLVDGHSPGTEDTRDRFYAALAARQRCGLLTAADEYDLIIRCRLLRHLPRQRAQDLVHAMACALRPVFERVRPAAVLSHMVDDYVTHLVALMAGKFAVRYVGYAYSYFPGMVQLTEGAYGKPFDMREPSPQEVATTLQTVLQRTYRQNYTQRDNYTWLQHLRSVARYQVKRAVFAARARSQRDPWNLHYAVTPYIVERRKLADYPKRTHFADDWRGDLARARARLPGPTVYLPLGYFPESTIDYWIADLRILDYEQQVLEMVSALAASGPVLVKEHLHMMGSRATRFYEALAAMPGVVSVHPCEFSNDVLEAADCVVLGAGSVGVEATLRDKPVFSFCATSYWFDAAGATALDLGAKSGWRDQIARSLDTWRPMSAERKAAFLSACLRSAVLPRAAGRRWPHIEVSQLRALLQQATAATSRPEPSNAVERTAATCP
jgi:hypothetical protein